MCLPDGVDVDDKLAVDTDADKPASPDANKPASPCPEEICGLRTSTRQTERVSYEESEDEYEEKVNPQDWAGLLPQ